MENSVPKTDWQSLFFATYDDFASALLALLPKVLTAAIILLAGLLIAHLLKFLVRRLIISLLGFIQKSGLLPEGQNSLLPHPELLISRLIFWFVLIFFIVAAARSFGFDFFSQWLASLLGYLPIFVTAAVILTVGVVLSSMAKALVTRLSIVANLGKLDFIARLVQIIIVVTSIVIAIEHLGVDVSFLTTALIVLLGVIALGFSLAFGLGTKELIANITGAQACRRHFQEGDEIIIDDQRGHVIEIGQSHVIVESKTGRHIVPAKTLFEKSATIITPDIDN